MDTAEQLRDKVDDPSTSLAPSLLNTDNLQGIYVYQLPFPGTLPEKAQREQLAAVVRKYSKIVEIRFDAVPNNPDVSAVQSARRYQLPPLSRRALILFQKISATSFEGLLGELNKQVMSQCHLSASMAKTEHISAIIAMRNATSAGHNASKAQSTTATKSAQPNQQTPSAAEQPQQQQQSQQQYPSKRPLTLLKIQPPPPAVKAFAMDSQTHTQPDPFHKNASRTLYVKHLDNTITEEELKVRYGKFGHILDIEVKNRNTMAPYAFIQFTNIESVANAIKAFNQHIEDCGAGARQKKNSNLHWWGNTIVTSRLWIGRLPPNCGEQYLMSKMRVVLTQPDDVTQVIYDATFNEAIVMFVGHESTQIAFNKVKNRNITFQPAKSLITEPVHHVHVDFCSEKLHDYFIDRLYEKNTEPLLSDVILAPPPDPPKCLTSLQPKKSPSPPPDPSIETIGHSSSLSKRSIGRQKVLLADCEQQNASLGFDKALPSSHSSKTEHSSHHFTTTKHLGRTLRETAHANSMAEETQQSHRDKTTTGGKSQDSSERGGRFGNVRCTRSNSPSSNTSTDTYSQSPRKRWRHPPQTSELNEFSRSNSRQKMTAKKPSSETKHTWERKHRSQRSTERRRESRVERKEKRREIRQSRTRQTKGTARRTETERSVENASGDKSKRSGDYGGGTPASGSNKRSRTTSKVEKYKGRSKERSRAKASSSIGGCQLLPPPPAPPLRIDKVHDHQQHKRRRSTSSSSGSHSSCTCSSCSSDSSSNSRSSSLSEDTDSELSSSENEADEERPSNRRSHRSRKDGHTGALQVANVRPLPVNSETTKAQPVTILSEPLQLAAPIELKTIGIDSITKVVAGRESEKTAQPKTIEENNKDEINERDEQPQRKEPIGTTAKENDAASKKSSNASSLHGQLQPQTVSKLQAPRPSQRTIVCIPLDAQSEPPFDPRLCRSRQICGAANAPLCLELPRFSQKMKMPTCSSDRSSSSNVRGDSVAMLPEVPTNTKPKVSSAASSSNEWIKREPGFSAEVEQNIKIEDQKDDVAKMEKKSAGADTMNLLAAITERIKCVENGITEFKTTVQTEQTKASTNFDQVELEVSRIRTELTSGVSLQHLELAIAQRSAITTQINTSTDAGGGRQIHTKTITDNFQASNGDDEADKNKRNDETEGGELHDRRYSFVSEPEMPIRSFSLSCDHHPTTSTPKAIRVPHEKDQLTPTATLSSTSPLAKQTVDGLGIAFSRKPKHLLEPSPSQLQHRSNTVGIPKLKELKLDRKPSAVPQLAIAGDSWMSSVIPFSPFKKDKEMKSERREQRSDSIGHFPTMMAKEHRKEGLPKVNLHQQITKKALTTMSSKSLQKQQHSKDDRKAAVSVAFGGGGSTSGGHVEELKKQIKPKAKFVENDLTSDVDRQHTKQRRKKRAAEQSSSSGSDESLEESDLFTGVDVEEQKRMMAAIKSGVGFGLSMYDRVKRRSSKLPEDEQKKKTALEVIKTKHAKKRQEFSRVRLSSSSTDSEGSESVQTKMDQKSETGGIAEPSSKPQAEEEEHSSSAEEVGNEPNSDEDDEATVTAEKEPKRQQNNATATIITKEVKVTNSVTNLTIRRPQIAPRKPFMEEPKIRDQEEGEEANSSASSVAGGSISDSESENDVEDEGEMDAGDRAIKKLKNQLSRYRKSSESSMDEAKHFNEKLAKVVSIAAQGCYVQSSPPHSEKSVESSSSSSSSSESGTDNEPTSERLKGNGAVPKKLPSQKKVKHLSMEDVFGADSSDESSDERAAPPPRPIGTTISLTTTAKQKIFADTSSKNIVVPKINIEHQKEAKEIPTVEREKVRNKSILAINEHGKRIRVSSVSSVSSIEQKRFKGKRSADSETTTTKVRDRSKSDATALKKAQQRQQQKLMPTANALGNIATRPKTEIDKKMKQQTQMTKTKATIGTKMTVKTSKNLPLMKHFVKKQIMKDREEKKLYNLSTVKRATECDMKGGQTAKRAKTEKPKEHSSVIKDKEQKESDTERRDAFFSLKSAPETAESSEIPNTLAEGIAANQQKPMAATVHGEKDGTRKDQKQEDVTNRKNEADELLNIVAAERMAESEFEIIDSGKVSTTATDKTAEEHMEKIEENEEKEEEENKKQKEEEREKEQQEKRKREEKRKQQEKMKLEEDEKMKMEEDAKKREKEQQEKKKREKEEAEKMRKKDEAEKKRQKEEDDKKKEKDEQEKKWQKEEEEKRRQKEEEEKKRQKEEEERKRQKEEEKKRQKEEKKRQKDEEKRQKEEEKRQKEEEKRQKEEEKRQKEEEKRQKEEEKRQKDAAKEMPTEDEDDEEAMEAELLRRMEERNEEEAAVASLGLQSKVDRKNSQDLLNQHSDDITHILGPNEKAWNILEGPSSAHIKMEERIFMMEKEEGGKETEDRKWEEKIEEGEGKEEEKALEEETIVREEERGRSTISGEKQHTATYEPTTDKTSGFKFETVERRASNESVDSHMAGVGNGFVEVDAEHLRQQKREQDALERLAEERRRTEETVKRMAETVDAVATNSTALQQQEATIVPHQRPLSPNLAQQQQLDSFNQLNRHQNAHQAPAVDTFVPQQRDGGIGDYFYATNMGMGSQTQNQQHEVVQALPVNSMSMNIQSQYVQHQKPVHSLQHNFPLPPVAVADVLNVHSGDNACKTVPSSITTAAATTSPYAHLMPTTSTVSAQQDQQQQQEQSVVYQYGQHQQQQQQLLQQQQQLAQHFQQQQQVHSQYQPLHQQQKPSEIIVNQSSSISVGVPSQYDTSAPNSAVESSISRGSSLVSQQHSVIQHQDSVDKAAYQQQHQQSFSTNPNIYAHQLQLNTSSVSEVMHQQGMANVFEGMVQDKAQQHHQQQQTLATSMMLQQRKISDMKLQQQQQAASTMGQTVQQSPIVQNPQQGLIDRRLDVHPMQQPQQQQQQYRLEQRLEQTQPQQRQQFQMQHIVQASPVVQKQQQPKQQQLSSIATASVQLPQQVQQPKKVPQRQRKVQQMPTISTQNQQQKQFTTLSGQYPQQQQEQQQQQQHYQQQPGALSAMTTTGLMDHQSLVSLYQQLRDQQQILQQAQQMPSISAAMIAAASATNHFTPSTLSKWPSIVTPSSTMSQGGALEELLRHGLLAPQAPALVPPSGRVDGAGTSAMTAPTSFEEMFQHKLSDNSSSPRGFTPQQQQMLHQQMSSNDPQRIAANIAQQQQQSHQQKVQQNLLSSGGSAQNQQIHPVQQPQPKQQQPSIMCHATEKLQLPQQQQQHVHANVSLQQPPPQRVMPPAEQQQQIPQQSQQKMAKKQSSANKYPVLWQGQLAMKNADTLVQMHKVCGNESLVHQMNVDLSSVNENGIPLLRINQRMRLEQTHLENLIRKMEREDNQLALICLPCGRDREDVVIQTQKMNIAFIEYFSSKSAAGIVSSGPAQQPSALVAHIFPPSDFSRMLLSRNAPDLLRTVESLNAGYLFVILTNK